MRTGDSENSEMVGNSGLVCVDIDAVDDGGLIRGFDWMETVAVVGLTWMPTWIWILQTDSWYSHSS